MSHSSDNSPVDKQDFKHEWYHVNAAMIPAKLAYFADLAKRVGFAPFMVPFLVSIGLNKAEAGVIVGFRLIGSIVGGPFWGLIADKKQSHFIIFCALIICSSFFLCSQVFLSIPLASKEINKCPAPDLESGNNSSVNITQHDKQTSEGFTERKRLFFVLLAVNIVACFFEGSVLSFLDFAVVRKIQRSAHRKIEYGKQRSFSSVGAAVSVAVTNAFIANFPTTNVSCYSAIFVMYVVWGLLCLFSSSFLFRDIKLTAPQSEDSSDGSESRKRENLRKALKETCFKLDTMLYFASAFMAGTLHAVYRSFIYVYLKELNADTILLTMIMVIAYLFSVPVFFFAESITKFLGGTWQGITLPFAIFCVRFLTISFIQNPWLALLIESTHAFTFPYFIAVSVRRIREISPVCILTTMYSISHALTYAIGYIAGSSIGGVVYEEFGGRTMYRIFGILSGVSFVGISVYVCITIRRKKCSVADIASS